MKLKNIFTFTLLLITNTVNAQPNNDDLLKLLKGRNDIIITVKHYTYEWDYVLCADIIRETEPSYLSCDFEIASSTNKELMEFKAEKIKQLIAKED